jgi:hypothetical protein
MSARPKWLPGLVALTSAGAVLGCQLVFGDFDLVHVDGSGGTTGAGGSSGEPCYAANGDSRRCSTDQPQECTNGVWTNAGIPCSAGLCNVNKGSCDVCFPLRMQCNGTSLDTCKDDGSGWDSQDCSTVGFCDSGKYRCVACREGETYCLDTDPSKYKICNGDQTGFDVKPCPTKGSTCVSLGGGNDQCTNCNPAVDVLPKCTNAGQLLTCEQNLLWTASNCTPPKACYQPDPNASGFCQ